MREFRLELFKFLVYSIGLMVAVCGLAGYANAADKYIRFGCTYNGNGNSNACAESNGAAGAYSTLENWEAQDANLTGTGVQNVYIYCENCSSADTTSVHIVGWTMTATDYVNIVVDSTARHNGKWNTSKYRLSTTNQYGSLRINPNMFIKIDGMQIENTSTGSDNCTGLYIYSANPGGGSLTLTNSIVKSNTKAAAQMGNDQCMSLLIYNNFFVGGTSEGTADLRFHTGGCSFDIYNNTFISNGGGWGVALTGQTGWSGTATFKNNLSYGGATNDYSWGNYGTGTLTTSNNATADTSSPDNTYDSQCTETGGSDCFVDAANGDYHLISTADVIDDGADLSGTFTNDIDYQTRSGSWDIGADEYQSTGSAIAALIASGEL